MFKSAHDAITRGCLCLILVTILNICLSQQQQQQDGLHLKTDPIYLDLYHKFDLDQEFKLRGSILVRPKTDYRIAQASIISQPELSQSDLNFLKASGERVDESYFLKAVQRRKKGDQGPPAKTVQTLIKACSLYTSNLVDFLTINLSPYNDFISVNIHTSDPECNSEVPQALSNKFNTTIQVDSGNVGPVPDTATYIKRLEEERQNKLREGKEDNRSFFAKYWIYIVPAVIILMMFSGPAEQGR